MCNLVDKTGSGVEMNEETLIQAVIFDFDGTLADTRSSTTQCFWEVLNRYQISLPKHFSMEALLPLTCEEAFQSIPDIAEDMIPEAITLYNRHYTEIAYRKARLFPEILETLNALRYASIPLAIATNENRKNLDKLTVALQIESFFDLTICYDEVPFPKPSPEMAKQLIDKLGVSAEKTLVVGDSVLDIEMGRASGCQTCAVTYGVQSQNTLQSRSPHWVVDNFSDILNIIDSTENFKDHPAGKRKSII